MEDVGLASISLFSSHGNQARRNLSNQEKEWKGYMPLLRPSGHLLLLDESKIYALPRDDRPKACSSVWRKMDSFWNGITELLNESE